MKSTKFKIVPAYKPIGSWGSPEQEEQVNRNYDSKPDAIHAARRLSLDDNVSRVTIIGITTVNLETYVKGGLSRP